jgi:hypothetical protein
LDQSEQRLIFARDGLSAFDPTATLAVHCGNGFEAGFSLSLSQTLSRWQLIENQAILVLDEGSLQTYWLDARRSAPVAGNARGRDLDVTAANKRPAAGRSKETLLQYHRPIDSRWSLSVIP